MVRISVIFWSALLSVSLAEPKLVWRSGDSVTGELVRAGASSVTWKSPQFEEPFEVRYRELREISISEESNPVGQAYFVGLQSRGRLFGEVTGKTEGGGLELKTESHGTIELKREDILCVRRISHGLMRWAGPLGDFGWLTPEGKPISTEPNWREAKPHGPIEFISLAKPAFLPMDFPEKFAITLGFKAASMPEFSTRLTSGENVVKVESWGNRIVVRVGNWFREVKRMKKEDREVSVQLFWDWKAGKGFATAGEDGETVEWSFNVAQKEPEAKDGVQVMSKCRALQLVKLRMFEWPGQDPYFDPLPTPEHEFEGLMRAPSEVAKFPYRFEMKDAAEFHGEIIDSNGREIRVRTGFSDQPVRVPLTSLKRLRFAKDSDPLVPSKSDQLVLGESEVRGRWIPRGGAIPHWEPEGGKSVVKLVKPNETGFRVTRALGGVKRGSLSSLLHFANGESVVGELIEIDPETKTVKIESDLVHRDEFPQEALRGAILKPIRPIGAGFLDKGWRALGKKLVDRPSSDNVRIREQSQYGHPNILASNQLNFQMRPTSDRMPLMVRLRMFTAGLDAESPSTNITIGVMGKNVYMAQEFEGRRPSYIRNFQTTKSKEVDVTITWNRETIWLKANEGEGTVVRSATAQRSGFGLILENGSIWGHSRRQDAELHAFKVAERPEFTWVPSLVPEVKEQALFVPRFRRDNAPKHLLVAETGDVLRGNVEAVSQDSLTIQSRLDKVTVARDSVAAMIWLGEPQLEVAEKAKPESEGEAEESSEEAEASPQKPEFDGYHWIILRSGARLRLKVENFGPLTVTGESDLLGRCEIPASQVYRIDSTPPKTNPAAETLASYRVQPAPEPRIEGVAEDSGLVGEVAPEIELPLLSGETFKLSENAGKVVIVDFWASWCAPCIRKMPELMKIASQFPNEQVRFVAVNLGEPKATVVPFLERQNWADLEVAFDLNRKSGEAYDVSAIPTTVIIDREGKIAHFAEGGNITAEMVRDLLTDGVQE